MTPAPIRYLVKSLTLVPIVACHQLTKLIPRDRKRVCIGAWFGNLYADNPKYFAEYLLENSDFEITWIGNESVRKQLPQNSRMHFARKGSLHAVFELLRAKFWICCIFCVHDLTSLPVSGGAVCINLWHGIPVKRNGFYTAQNGKRSSVQKLFASLERIYANVISGEKEWLLVSSNEMANIQLNGYDIFSKDRLLRIGTPRNDFLLNNKMNTALKHHLKEKYSALLGFNADKKIVLYLPTWRMSGKNVFCFYSLDTDKQAEIKALLDSHSAILIEKHHFHTYELHPTTNKSICSTVITTEQFDKTDAQELLLCADIVISDYSGAYVDFGLLERPCIHFAYDLDEYSNSDAGLSYDLNNVAAGPVSTTLEELLRAVQNSLDTGEYMPSSGYCRLVEFETGTSCKNLLAFMKDVCLRKTSLFSRHTNRSRN